MPCINDSDIGHCVIFLCLIIQVLDDTKQLLFCFNELCFLLIQANTERKLRQVEEQLNESNSKLADHEATIVALTSSQAKLQSEANELGSQLSEAESKIGTLSKAKSGLEAQVEDLKSELESESAVSQQYALVEKLVQCNLEYLDTFVHGLIAAIPDK